MRYHSVYLVDGAGAPLGQECTLCHSLLPCESPAPFQYLEPLAEGEAEGPLHEYLRGGEFLRSCR